MKKLILVAIIAISAIASSQAQYYVTEKVIPTDIPYVKTMVLKVGEQEARIVREWEQYKKRQDINLDTIHYETEINQYLTAVNNLTKQFANLFSVTDTIQVTKVDTEYYLEGDNVNSIADKKAVLWSRYQRLIEKYGKDNVKGLPDFKQLETAWIRLSGFENQLNTQ